MDQFRLRQQLREASTDQRHSGHAEAFQKYEDAVLKFAKLVQTRSHESH
jgi:hypothetical protein